MTKKLLDIGVEIHDSSDFMFECLSAPEPYYDRQSINAPTNAVDVDEKTICLQSGTAATSNIGYYDPYDAIPPSKEAFDMDEVQFKGFGSDW